MNKLTYTEVSFHEMQRMELEILKEIDAICRQHHITYFLMYGTLLGAIRHQNFIPWDYDIDIALIRDNFDRLLEVLAQDEHFKQKYFIQTSATDKKFFLSMARILIRDTKFCWANGYTGPFKNGIHIDLFPFEKQKVDEKTMKKRCAKNHRLNTLSYYRFGNINTSSLFRKIMKPLVRISLFPLTAKYFAKARIKLGKNDDCPLEEAMIGHFNGLMNYMPGSWFVEVEDVMFAGQKFMMPAKYDDILHFLYGDYMKLPPVSERTCDVKGYILAGDDHE